MSTEFDEVRRIAVEFAVQEAGRGVRETGQENRGDRVDVYQRAAGGGLRNPDTPGRQWCGMFIYWCYRQAARRFNLILPFTADDLWAGEKLVRWSRGHQNKIVRTCPILPGDIYVMNSYHIGMAIEQTTDGEHFRSIDGNQATARSGAPAITTNNIRLFSSCRLFVRI